MFSYITTKNFSKVVMLLLLISTLVIIIVGLTENKGAEDEKGIQLSKSLFTTNPVFNIGAFAVMLALVALYAIF